MNSFYCKLFDGNMEHIGIIGGQSWWVTLLIIPKNGVERHISIVG